MRQLLPLTLASLLLAAALMAAMGAESFQKVPKESRAAATPPPQSPPVEFVGNKSYTPEQLKAALAASLQEIAENGLTRPRADDAAYFLSVYYRKQGYPLAEVKWEIRGSGLVLTVKEGPHTLLRKISYEGNHVEPGGQLDEYMIGETGEQLTKPATKDQPQGFPFVEADIQTGVARVRGLYESDGYLDAVVDDAEITYSADKTRADVMVRIVEGGRYIFGDIVFKGDLVFDRDTLLKGTKDPVKEAAKEKIVDPLDAPYTTQRVNAMQKNLEFYFKMNGYYAAEVSASGDPKKAIPGPRHNSRVPVTFTIKSGPQYRFDGVTVEGLDRLHPSFLQNRFRGLSGRIYNPSELDEKYREVLQTGLFHELKISTVPLPSHELRIDLKAEEAKAKQIGFSVGFSTYEGVLFGVRLADLDFMGRGRPLSFNVDYTSRSLRAELLYVDPWLFESQNSLRARLFAQTRDEIGYSKQEVGARADLTRDLIKSPSKNVEVGTYFSARDVTVTTEGVERQFLGPTSYQIFTLGVSQSFDFRDNKVNPSKGWIATFAEDVDSLAGDVAFGRGTARLTYFIPIKTYLLALGARTGAIYPVSDIPIDERFFNGGGSTVRSFPERRLGPADKSGKPIGGEFFTVFNAELEIPIKDALSGAVFVDAGNLIAEFKDAGFNDMRYAVGLGVRYKLPIGPVRLDVGLNPDPKMNEHWGAVHFSFGFAF